MSCGFPAGFLWAPAVFRWVFRGQKDWFMTMGMDHNLTNFDPITEADNDDNTINCEAENGAKVEKEDAEKGAEELVLWHALAHRSPHINNHRHTSTVILTFESIGKPEATSTTTTLGCSVMKFGAIFWFFKSPEGSGVHSIVVCHSTAWFYHENCRLWPLLWHRWGWGCMQVIRWVCSFVISVWELVDCAWPGRFGISAMGTQCQALLFTNPYI